MEVEEAFGVYEPRQDDDPVEQQLQQQDQNKKDEKQKKRKINTEHRFKPEKLTNPKTGLVFFYSKLDKYKKKMDFSASMDEQKELAKLMAIMQEWHYLVAPQLDFEFFVEKCQKFGPKVQGQLGQMRKAHKNLLPWSFFTEVLEELNENLENVNNIQQEINVPQIEEKIVGGSFKQNESIYTDDVPIHSLDLYSMNQSAIKVAPSQSASRPSKKLVIKSKFGVTPKKELKQESSVQQTSLVTDIEGNIDEEFAEIEKLFENAKDINKKIVG